MREIIFRGKRIDNGEWVYGGILQTDNWSEISVVTDYYGSMYEPPSCEVDSYEVIPETVGQYTGLTDKNGTKIFEGDIVKGLFVFGEISSVVIFKYGSFGIEWNIDEIKVLDPFLGLRNIECEVIGNIHDNPELLKGGDESDT